MIQVKEEYQKGQVSAHRDLSLMHWGLSPMKIVLASSSPRRTELLQQAGIAHIVMPAECEEVISSNVPQDVVIELAGQKAEEVYQRCLAEHEDGAFLVIGADTVVTVEGKILGKPIDEDDAFAMLSSLQGRSHQVYTGVSLIKYEQGTVQRKSFFESSAVHAYPVSEEELRDYIATGEPMDKAGAYGIQARFAIHIERIEGDYNNIVGLPIARIYQEIKKW